MFRWTASGQVSRCGASPRLILCVKKSLTLQLLLPEILIDSTHAICRTNCLLPGHVAARSRHAKQRRAEAGCLSRDSFLPSGQGEGDFAQPPGREDESAVHFLRAGTAEGNRHL